MMEFLEAHIPSGMRGTDKAFTLAYAMLDPYLLGFRYDPAITLGAEDAFVQKSGNCLTFSSLFVAMARAAGLRAWYQEVKVPPNWSNINETLLVNLHVNAIVQYRDIEYVVDVSDSKPTRQALSRKLSDNEALGQYYNNKGVEALLEDRLSEALAYFVKAIETEPDISYVWSNLGVVYRRNGQDGDAKLAYQQALKLNSGESAALSNLYSILMDEGDDTAAQIVQSKVERHRLKNPYYLYYLSAEAVEEQRYDDAIKLLRRAIRMEDGDYRFHVILARSLLLNGDDNAAQLSLDRAKKLAPADSGLATMNLPELADYSET